MRDAFACPLSEYPVLVTENDAGDGAARLLESLSTVADLHGRLAPATRMVVDAAFRSELARGVASQLGSGIRRIVALRLALRWARPPLPVEEACGPASLRHDPHLLQADTLLEALDAALGAACDALSGSGLREAFDRLALASLAAASLPGLSAPGEADSEPTRLRLLADRLLRLVSPAIPTPMILTPAAFVGAPASDFAAAA